MILTKMLGIYFAEFRCSNNLSKNPIKRLDVKTNFKDVIFVL